MPRLSYERIRHDGSSRYALLVSAKVKELIDWKKIQTAGEFVHAFKSWMESMPRKNSHTIDKRYQIIQDRHRVHIMRRMDIQDPKSCLTIFEIIEHPDN